MALSKQNIPIVFGKGIETKYDEKVVQADKMLELENAIFTKKMTFSTRHGSDLLPKNILNSTEHIQNSKKLMTFQDELLLATDSTLYSYNSSTESWASRGSISAVAVNSKSIVRNTYSQTVPDGNTLKGVTVYAWEENSTIKATVIDENTGLPLLAETQLSASGVKPKVFVNSTYIFVYYIEGSNWQMRRLNPANPSSFDAAVTVAANIASNFDLYPHGKNLVFIYNNTSNLCSVGYIQLNGEIGTSLQGFPSMVSTAHGGEDCVGIISKFDGTETDRIYALFANASHYLYVAVYDLGLNLISEVQAESLGGKIWNVGAVFLNDSSIRIYYEYGRTGTGTSITIKKRDIDYNANFLNSQVTYQRGAGLWSKPFKGPDNSIYLVATVMRVYQPVYFLLKDTDTAEKMQVCSVIAQGEGSGLTVKESSLVNVFDLKVPNLIKTQLQSASGVVYSLTGLQVTNLSFEDKKLFLSKELGKTLHIAGGQLYNYDGVSAVEHNFHLFPEYLDKTITAGGGTLTAGVRQYCACYEWTDNQGQIHRSAPSIPIVVTNVLNDLNSIRVEYLNFTKKCTQSNRTNLTIVIYRTINAGTIFYRCSSLTSPTYNNKESQYSYTDDTLSDSSLIGNDVLYTTGGVLENYNPGSARLVEEYRNRLVLAGLEDDHLIRYSQERVINEEINFAEELSFRNDSGKSGIEAIARLDEKLIIFKASEIYYQIGQGPTSTGAQDDYQQPIFITTDVGTTDPQSVISMPLGLMFKSNKGYYLLSRALDPIYIGQSVEKYNDLKNTGAILCDDCNEVRFTHSDGVTLSYNYNEQQWSVFKNTECKSCVLWQNNWTILKDDDSVYVENKTSYFDGQTPVTKKLTTAWIQVANLQGAQRIYRVLFIGKLKSQHRLQVLLSYDFDDSIKEQFIFDTEQILGSSYYGEGYYGQDSYYGGADPVYQIEIRPSIQKCQAIRFTLQDLNDQGINGAGFELTGMTIQVGIKQGLYRPNIDKRVGPS